MYNVASCLAWAYLLEALVIHLTSSSTTIPASVTAARRASTWYASLRYGKAASPTNAGLHPALRPYFANLTMALQPYIARASTSFATIGEPTAWIQTFALLEVAHVLLGWVRAPLVTTAMQVASRLAVVWVIVEQFSVVRTIPID